MDLVSVIVPVYKVEQYLEDCMKSILCQTYKKIEIILVDDGSPDHCPELCDKYARKDERVRVIHKKNGGLSDARNTGLENAKGDYICFIDSDDAIHPQMIEILYNQITKTNADISICNYFKGELTPKNWDNIYVSEKLVSMDKQSALNAIYESNDKSILMTIAWNKLYKKELFENIRYPQNRIHEDEFTTYQLLYLANRTVFIDENLYFYRQREGSIMDMARDKVSEMFYFARIEQIKFFKHQKLYELAKKAIYKIEYMILDKYQTEGITEEDKKKLLVLYGKLLAMSWKIIPIKYIIVQSYNIIKKWRKI